MTEEWQGDEVENRERALVQAPEPSWALREVTRAVLDVERELARRMRMRPTDYAALGHVLDAREPLGPAELSGRLGISTGSATELVDRLERAGHLERRRHPQDRRRVTLHVTDAAVGEVLAALAPLFAEIDALAAGFSAEEQAVVTRYLRGVARRMTAYARSRPE